MADIDSLQGLQQTRTGLEEESKRLEEKQTSLEHQVKILEEKVAIQALEEKNRTHHDAIRELEYKIANLGQQLKPSPLADVTSSEVPSEPEQQVSNNVDEGVNVGVMQELEQSEVEVAQEEPKKKKRGFF